MIRAYEMMVIFDRDVEEAAIGEHLKSITTSVEADGGKIVNTDNMGKKRFAYEINHKWEGTYVVFEIATPARDLHETERTLRLADDVVRHKVLRLPEAEGIRRGLLEDASPASAG